MLCLGFAAAETGQIREFEIPVQRIARTNPLSFYPRTRNAGSTANNIGDLTYAAYSCIHVNTNLLAAGDPLVEAQGEAA
jgi:hypothetical protein